MGAPRQTISVIINRSRILDQHRAWVRVGDVDAGFRDLHTGRVHCADEHFLGIVTDATAPLVATPERSSSTAELYRAALATARAA